MQDHLVLGMMSLTTMWLPGRAICTTSRAVTSVEGEGAWAWTTKLEEGVHFTPTMWMCECFGELWRAALMPVTRSTKDGWFAGLMWPRYQITAWGRWLPFEAGGWFLALGGRGGGGAGVTVGGPCHLCEALQGSSGYLLEIINFSVQCSYGDTVSRGGVGEGGSGRPACWGGHLGLLGCSGSLW